MRYFRIVDDMSIPHRRFLMEPIAPGGEELDIRVFGEGKFVAGLPSLRMPVDVPGVSLDLFFGPFDIPVARSIVGDILGSIEPAAIQRVPVTIDGDEEQYEIINVVNMVDCLDSARSRIERYRENDPVRPDRAGEVSMVFHETIDPARTGDHQIFRWPDWRIPIVVSERVKEALEKAGVRGIRYIGIMPDDPPAKRWERKT